jgi:hypothetical protein
MTTTLAQDLQVGDEILSGRHNNVVAVVNEIREEADGTLTVTLCDTRGHEGDFKYLKYDVVTMYGDYIHYYDDDES